MGQHRTATLALLVWMLAACTDARSQPDGGAGASGQPVGSGSGAAGGGGAAGSANAPECELDTDCILITKGCCACPPATRENMLATSRAQQSEAQQAQCSQQVACSPCPPSQDPPPLAPVFKAGCIARRCELVDLRSAELSKCSQDSDCDAVGLGCCGAYSDDPSEWVGVQPDADLGILECVPAPPCVPPMPHGEPVAFCAVDRHCAIRRRESTD